MNLETKYLGLTLRSPLVVSASPISQSLDNIRHCEDVGAGAVVFYSLFEEQIRVEQQIQRYYREHPTATPADALALFPAQKQFRVQIEEYLDHIASAKRAVAIPIIASINCKSLGNWTDIIPQLEQAGADALELNIYCLPANMDRTAEQIEATYLTIFRIVKTAVHIPVAVKLTPYFTNLASMAQQLDLAGADALVLFNRFYQPDFEPTTLQFKSEVPLGNASDLRLALHWIAILCGYLKSDLAATGGIYSAEDVVRVLMVGARVAMLSSVLLRDGIEQLAVIEQNLRDWLQQNDYASVAAVQGILRQFHSKDAGAFERAEYVRTLASQTTQNESAPSV